MSLAPQDTLVNVVGHVYVATREKLGIDAMRKAFNERANASDKLKGCRISLQGTRFAPPDQHVTRPSVFVVFKGLCNQETEAGNAAARKIITDFVAEHDLTFHAMGKK